MSWIVASSLKFRFLIVACAGAMMFFGVAQLRQMPVDVFPEFAPPRVEIQTAALGLSAAEVESLVTVPLEEALSGLPDLATLRSKSVSQLSSIEMIFEPGTDLIEARQVVAERMATVTPTLPTWAAPPFMMQPLSATSRVMKIGLSSDKYSVIDMSMITYWKIRGRLLRVPGVANVAIWGERLDMPQVQVRPAKLAKNGVTLDQVMETTADAVDAGILRYSEGAFIGTGGFLDSPTQRIGIRHVLPIVRPSDLAKVPITSDSGKRLRLSDVATVKQGHQPLIGDAVINDGPGLMLIVEKLPWGNTLDVTRGVEEAIDQMRPGLTGIDIDTTIFRPATFVETAIDNLTEALLLGAILVVLVLAFFLFEWRSALISVVTIPLSLMAAGLVLYLRGATVNTMILAGFVIALGAIVDDAIVDIENIVRRLRQHRREQTGKSTAAIVLEASLEVRGAVVYASLIEALALMPVFFLEGLTGSFFRPLAFSYALAVLVSLVIALTVTPAMGLILLRNAPLDRAEPPVMRWCKRVYERLLAPVLRTPRPAYAGVTVVMVAGLTLMPFLGQSLLPSFKERDFLMHFVTAPGTSLKEERRVTTLSSHELRAIPGVQNFGSHIGQALAADEVVGVDFGENWISVDPKVDYDQTIASIQNVVAGYPGIYRDVLTYLKERIREVLTGTSEAIVVRIYGEDLDVLRAKGEEVVAILGGIDGVIEEHVELQAEIPQLQVTADLEAATRHGLKPGDIRRASSTLLQGEEVADIFRGGKAYDVQVWSVPSTRRSVSDVENLMIGTPDGGQVALKEVADVEFAPTPNAIYREDIKRRIDVGANVAGRDLGSVVSEFEDKMEEVDFPRGFHAEILGENAEREAAQSRLLIFAVVAIIGIFLLLQTPLRSWRLATLSFITLPMALVGGVVAVFMSGGIVSLGSLVGFFTVLGIVARNGIMMVSHYQHLEEHEGETFGPALVMRGSKERLAPILMTALTTGLALVPLVIFGEIPGAEIEYPMGIVILGGLVTSTLLNLFVVPALYLRFGKSRAERLQATTA
ncbi:MAG: efflux RND transporter permease subunit [Actinobacteria bacterium]|nr:efflux RND transporter permease subunit [Actinomycetota bacterium]